MAKTTYSIRKGFEYQDLFCACRLLEAIEEGDFDARFQIESDEVNHIDDIVLKPTRKPPSGHQVKFHTTQEYVDSFDTFMERETPNSRSLLQKLYRGWKEWSADGEKECAVVFVSSNPAERGRYKFGSAIDTATMKCGQKFATGKDYQKARGNWSRHLSTDEQGLLRFLGDVTWRFAFESIDGLKREAAARLQRLRLPSNDVAIAELMETVGYCATEVEVDLSIREFIRLLWNKTTFREACEQRFSGFDWGVNEKRRANRAVVVVVGIHALPAFSGHEFSCLEEPIPWEDYRFGLTVPDLSGIFDDLREQWVAEYEAWHRTRIMGVLERCRRLAPDIVVFPRYAVPLVIATDVAEWGRANRCNVVLGGHTLPVVTEDLSKYASELRVDLSRREECSTETTDRVADVALRYDRLGRVSISHVSSPYTQSEKVESDIAPFDLNCKDGWLNVAVLPSAQAVDELLRGKGSPPELILAPCGVHYDTLFRKLQASQLLHGVPVTIASSSRHWEPSRQTHQSSPELLRGG